jgi:DNA mismatch repair protein MutL
VKLAGYLSKPDFMRSSRNMQYLYINNRPVENRFLYFHLSRAYEAVIPKGKYPAAIIFMEIDPSLVDVNIHPAKREVKLFDQHYIDDMIYNLALKCLDKPHIVPEKLFRSAAPVMPVTGSEGMNSYISGPGTLPLPAVNDDSETGSYSGSLFSTGNDDPMAGREFSTASGLKILGTVFNTYILIEDNDRLHLIDFHAAHERMIYDRILRDAGDIEAQELVFPVTLELPVGEFSLVMENIDIFRETGFEIEEFSDNTVIIRSVPVIIGSDKIDELIKNMIDNIKDGLKSNDLTERFYSLIACHSAKRSGDRLSVSDMESLGRFVLNGSMELRCPHGRPFLFSINQNDLERIFKRL